MPVVKMLKIDNGVCKEIAIDSVVGVASPGAIHSYAGSSAPNGWLVCNGASYLTADYPDLFAVIGYTYGGSGANFNVPDLMTRVPICYKSGDTVFGTMGAVGGAKTHVLITQELPVHNHGGITGAPSADHAHTYTRSPWNTAVLRGDGNQRESGEYWATTGGVTSNHNHNIAWTGGNGAHNNLQPYITLNYIIKY